MSGRYVGLVLGVVLLGAGRAPAAAPPFRWDRYGDPLPPGAVARMGTRRLRHGDAVSFAAYLPDGKALVTAGRDRLVRLWDLTGDEDSKCLRGFGALVTVLAFAPDGRKLAAGSTSDAIVRIWDIGDLAV